MAGGVGVDTEEGSLSLSSFALSISISRARTGSLSFSPLHDLSLSLSHACPNKTNENQELKDRESRAKRLDMEKIRAREVVYLMRNGSSNW